MDSVGLWIYLRYPHDPGSCLVVTRIIGWSAFVGLLLSEGLMTLRVWAVWGRNIYITVVLGVVYTGCFATIVFSNWKFIGGIQFDEIPFPIPNWEGCFLTGSNNFQYLTWTMVMVYDTVTFILMMIPAVKAYRGGGRPGVVRVIYQDGIKFFAILFLFSMVNIILITTDARHTYILTSIQRVLHSMIASRAIIHIRRQSSKQGILVASGETVQLRSFDVGASTTDN
ncbi:hypothetical protein PM082_018811 [Marasmius tenuissimus]|nr:hypothetical protein PM082_018811 [Marasmius tenuissimus]